MACLADVVTSLLRTDIYVVHVYTGKRCSSYMCHLFPTRYGVISSDINIGLCNKDKQACESEDEQDTRNNSLLMLLRKEIPCVLENLDEFRLFSVSHGK